MCTKPVCILASPKAEVFSQPISIAMSVPAGHDGDEECSSSSCWDIAALSMHILIA